MAYLVLCPLFSIYTVLGIFSLLDTAVTLRTLLDTSLGIRDSLDSITTVLLAFIVGSIWRAGILRLIFTVGVVRFFAALVLSIFFPTVLGFVF
jgi:hypothetical protein